MTNIDISIEESAFEWVELQAKNRDCSVEEFLGQLVEERMRQELGYAHEQKEWAILHKQAEPIVYSDLKPKQKENYNFHKAAAVLAEFGFTSIRLSDDWKGADFIALHKDGELDLKVQLKSVYALYKKYLEKGFWICFRHSITGVWYLYPHDEAVLWALKNTNLANTNSWQTDDGYWTNRSPSQVLMKWLQPYAIPTK